MTTNLSADFARSASVIEITPVVDERAPTQVLYAHPAAPKEPERKRDTQLRTLLILLLLTVFAILIQGYHPGAEDDGVYLPAVQQDLNPHLFARNAGFFRTQMEATSFDKVIATSVRLTHLPLAWAILIWQFLAILLILWGCLRIARFCFREPHAQWAGVALVAALLALPVTNTGLYLVDENLHPRALATAAILAAIAAALEKKWLITALLLAVACAFHPIMGPLGISYCIFLACTRRGILHKITARPARGMAVLLPLAWLFDPMSPASKLAMSGRDYYFLSRWTWYEWLGIFAPLLLLWWFSRIAKRTGARNLDKVSSSLVYYGTFQLAIALCIMLPPALMRLRPLQPMRFLHIVYLLLALLAGGLIGQKFLRRRAIRWAILFAPLCAGMFYAQCRLYPGTEHLELPGRASSNPYLQAFTWIRTHTPEDAYFAIDPHYLELPGEDFHGFRALAERSVMADKVKDAAVVTVGAQLGPAWQKQTTAETGWKHFNRSDFDRLHQQFDVTWAVIAEPGVEGMDCPYKNAAVLVCKLQ